MSGLGRYLLSKREARGDTHRSLAERCRRIDPAVTGIHASSLAFWESGYRNRRPSLAQFDVLADALGLTVEERLHALRLARLSSPAPDHLASAS